MFLSFDEVEQYELEITSNCNAACPLCARTDRKMSQYGNSELTLADIKQFFPERRYIERKQFFLCGVFGDPIVNPECMDICEYLCNMGASVVSISTNGSYNKPEWWTKLADLGVQVDFAVDGLEDTNHIYRVNTKWEVIQRNMTAFSEAGGNGTWQFIAFEHNEHQIESVKKHAERLGFMLKIRISGKNDRRKLQNHKTVKMQESVVLTGSKTLTDRTQIVKDITQIDIAQSTGDAVAIKKIVPTIACKSLRLNQLFVSSDGYLYPCCFLRDEEGKKSGVLSYEQYEFDVNNLRKYSIEEIVNSEYFSDIKHRWDPDHSAHLPRCIRSCGKNAASTATTNIIENFKKS